VTLPRVAYVIGTTTGGTGRHAAMLAEGCTGRRLTVSVFGPAATRSLFPAVAFTPVDIADRPRPARDAAAVLRLRRLLARYVPDVVHAHGLRAGAVTALALARTPRRERPAMVVTTHNAAPSGATARAAYLALERLTARRADAVLCVSADLAARMRRAGACDVALAVVSAPPAAAPSAEAVGQARAAMGAAGRPVVLAVGRLTPQKGFDLLLEAMTILGDREPAPLLVIAGDGPQAARLAARSAALGSDVRVPRPPGGYPGAARGGRRRRGAEPLGGAATHRAGSPAGGPAARRFPRRRDSQPDRRGRGAACSPGRPGPAGFRGSVLAR